eukprot:jgi/Ulvmu1/2892/UM146_0034.1
MQSKQDDQAPQGGGGSFSLWGFGSSVLENVTQNATSFVSTIVETDWNKEFQEIQEGLKEDTQTLEHEVEKKLGINHSKGESSATTREADGENAGEAHGFITDFGRRLVHGTAEIFQQVRQQVDAEFTSLEQEAAKKPRSSFPKRAGAGKFSRIDFKMTQLQRSGATYCDEPSEKEQFAAFLEAYDREVRQAEAEQILASNNFMADLHSRLVPLVISDDTFWQRYFFRVDLLKSEHEKRDQRLRQAHRHAGSEAGELPLDEPFDDDDEPASPLAAASPAAADAAADAAQSPPTLASLAPQPCAQSSPDRPPAAGQPADDTAHGKLPDAIHEEAAAAEPAAPFAVAVRDAGSLAAGAGDSDAAQAPCKSPESPVDDEVKRENPVRADDSARVAAEISETAAQASHAGASPGGSARAEAGADTALPQPAAAAASAAGAAVVAAGAVEAAAADEGAQHAAAVPSAEREEHACGSSGAGSAARSPQSSGNVMSSEWSIVSGTQAVAAGVPGHANGVHREHVPAVEEGEEGHEDDIDVQEEDVNFDDLDSLDGDVDGEGDDEEDIDENWGQWE